MGSKSYTQKFHGKIRFKKAIIENPVQKYDQNYKCDKKLR